MTSGDIEGVDIYKNNKVSREYKSKTKIRNLKDLRTTNNIREMLSILSNSAFVDIQPDGKIIWKGRLHKGGYALINTKILPDRPPGFENGMVVLGHRLVQELINGGAPTNALVCHRSDVRANLEPKDLFLGTHANNSKCISMHGRRIYPKGEEHWSAKLCEGDVVEIVHLYFANVMTIKNIAKEFDVCSHTISNIVNGKGPWIEIANRARDAAIAARMG